MLGALDGFNLALSWMNLPVSEWAMKVVESACVSLRGRCGEGNGNQERQELIRSFDSNVEDKCLVSASSNNTFGSAVMKNYVVVS